MASKQSSNFATTILNKQIKNYYHVICRLLCRPTLGSWVCDVTRCYVPVLFVTIFFFLNRFDNFFSILFVTMIVILYKVKAS